MAVGVAFALVVLALIGSAEAGSYLAGFLMEKALSLDNVFVIAVLLGTFAVPQGLKADVLTFGIAVALMLPPRTRSRSSGSEPCTSCSTGWRSASSTCTS